MKLGIYLVTVHYPLLLFQNYIGNFVVSDQGIEMTEFTSVTAMLLVVLQAVKIKIHFGVLLLSALLRCLKINHDMLWYNSLGYTLAPTLAFM